MGPIQLRFLLDEDVPAPVGRFLSDVRGHHVEYVVDVMPSAKDPAVLQLAEDRGAILITKNRRHFDKLWNRTSAKTARRFGHAGMIYLRLGTHEAFATDRMKQVIDLIEFEWTQSQELGDKKIIIDLHYECIRISR